jgi:hypothetical protein
MADDTSSNQQPFNDDSTQPPEAFEAAEPTEMPQAPQAPADAAARKMMPNDYGAGTSGAYAPQPPQGQADAASRRMMPNDYP